MSVNQEFLTECGANVKIFHCICDKLYSLVVLEESQLIIQVIRSDLIMCAKFHVNTVIVV